MLDKKISVIIATYNRKDLLQRCIFSILEQVYPKDKYEVIIVDDASTDGTYEIMQELVSNNNANLFYHRKERGGAPSALNVGIKKAKGEIFAFIDDDVVVKKDWLEKAAIFLDTKKAGILEGKIETIPEDVSPFTHQNEKHKSGRYETANIFYNRKIIEDIGGFDEKFRCSFRYDSDVAFGALEKGYEILFSPDVVVINPPSKAELSLPFKLAWRYYIDPLLFKKHPYLYKHNLELHNFNGIKISRPRQKLYKVYILSFIISCISLIARSKTGFMTGAGVFFISYIGILLVHLRIWQIRHIKFKDFLLSIPIFAAVPFAYMYWLIRGMIKFKKVILW